MGSMLRRAAPAAAALLAAAACRVDDAPARGHRGQATVAPADAAAVSPAACRVLEKGLTLPDELKESSGFVELDMAGVKMGSYMVFKGDCDQGYASVAVAFRLAD